MGTVLERQNYSPTYLVKDHRFPFEPGRTNVDNLRLKVPESTNWIKDYKKTPGSIFKYYSVNNEFDFLKSAGELAPEKQEYYIQENVKRYLGEFVGKIPYTTIHYEMDNQGFMFAGMHVMDSYRKAAEITHQSREQAEVVGFQMIQDALSNAPHEAAPPNSAYWISPPKDWDYGFMFILKVDDKQHVTEYILRYPEKKGEFTKSNELLTLLDPHMRKLHDSDDFLLIPQFGKEKVKATSDLDTIMRTIGGTSEEKIAESHYFEEQIDKVLGTWISEYSKRIVNLSKKDKNDIDYAWHVEQAEILLLSIYQQAEDIIKLHPFQQISPEFGHFLGTKENIFSQEQFESHTHELRTQGTLPQVAGGSCPAIEGQAWDSVSRFITNIDFANALKSGIKIQDLMANGLKKDRYEDYNCPHCGYKMKGELKGRSDTWAKNCPHCEGKLQCAKT
jgi:hypothetical protein